MKTVIPTARTVKTAISLPVETYALAERIRKKTGSSRSALYADALREYARALAVREAEAQYVAGYERIPEDLADAEAWLKVSAAVLKKERW